MRKKEAAIAEGLRAAMKVWTDANPEANHDYPIETMIRVAFEAFAAYAGLDRPEIVCLCGSSRFVEQMAVIAWAFERDEGKIALGLHLLPASYPGIMPDHQAEHEGVAEKMDALHRRKIDLADRVFVVNVGGYIGESTAGEIEYAKETGKPIAYLEEPS